jgi:hypothetical protein
MAPTNDDFEARKALYRRGSCSGKAAFDATAIRARPDHFARVERVHRLGRCQSPRAAGPCHGPFVDANERGQLRVTEDVPSVTGLASFDDAIKDGCLLAPVGCYAAPGTGWSVLSTSRCEAAPIGALAFVGEPAGGP